jgi:ribosomal subunit interface protein
MDIVVRGRNVEVPDHYRQHVADKLSRVERYAHHILRADVELYHEKNPRQSDICQRVEITCRVKGPVVRAEACAADPYAALDLATAKLEARLRKAADRRRVHHGRRSPVSVSVATATLAELEAAEISDQLASAEAAAAQPVEPHHDGVRHAGPIEVEGEGPMVVREKTHSAPPIDLGQALYEMELVGHDFYLFVDADTKLPSVVYRRRGYDYGVIHLEENGTAHYSGAHPGTSAA